MKRKNKVLTCVIASLTIGVSLVLGISTVGTNLTEALLNRPNNSAYSLTLNASNKTTANGDKVQKTALGNDVTFTYSNVANSTTGHVTLNDGGYLTNKDQIRSITSFTCTFSSGALNAKLSYGGGVWNDGFSIVSGTTYETGSNPYFIKFTATGTTLINSIVIEFSCVENPAAHEGETGGDDVVYYQKVTNKSSFNGEEYLIVYEADEETAYVFNGNLTTLDATNNYLTSEIDNGVIASSTNVDNAAFTIDADGHVVTSGGYYIGDNSDTNALSVSESTKYTNTVSVTDGELTVNSYGGAYLRFNSTSNQMRFRYYKSSTYTSQKAIALYEKVVEQGAIPFDTPKDCIGFTATDSKATNYKTTDVFDTNNGLTVVANYNDGTTAPLSKGGVDGYSYIVKDSNDNEIDTSVAFGGTRDGIYTVVVSYKDYIPQEIQINVVFVVKITEITANCATLTFNTAQKLSDYTNGITADLIYNKITHNQTGVPYSDFAAYKISLVLLDPSGVAHDINTIFGAAGIWSVKIVSDEDAAIFDTEGITVNAIPVQTITVNGSSSTLQEEDTMQLTLAVTPSTATDQTVTWTSSNNSVASVNNNGLVTANAVGEARITATANDGSGVYGYIDLTVTAKPAQTEFEAEFFAGDNASECTVNENDGVKVGTSSNSGDMSFTVGAGATKVSFYAAGWKGSSTTITLSATGVTFNPSASVALTADDGVSYSTPFTLQQSESTFYKEVNLSGVSTDTTITVSSSTRFVIWNIRYYTTAVEPVYPTSITLTGDNTISVGGTTQLTVGYTPLDTNVKHVTYSSNHTNYATVSETGLVTGVAAGTARITATAETNASGGTTTAYIDITVNTVAVSSVSLNKTTLSLRAGNSETLTATISPSNAGNKSVTWSSSNTSVATVNNGTVAAVAEGTSTITVTTVDGNKTATCLVTVTTASSAYAQDIINNAATTGDLGSTGTTTWASDFTITLTSGASYKIHSMGTKNTSNALQWNTNGYLYSTTSGGIITSISAVMTSGKSITVYGSNSAFSDNSGGTEIGTITGSDSLIPSSSYEYIRIKGASSGNAITSITIEYGTPEPVDPTGITVSPSSVELAKGNTKQLTLSYTPSNANQNKDVTWSRYSGSSNITVDSTGKITVSSSASVGNSAVIRATLNFNGNIYSQCTVTVIEQQNDDQTILIYMCGSDLESNGQNKPGSAAGYATGDITEILKVGSQPDDVNVVIETGGAKCWKTTHGINANYLERYHVANKQLVRDAQLTKASMGLTSTLQSFVTWGVQTYPADRISLILWNHGGAMRGVCYDELANDDCLLNSEVKAAIGNSFNDLGRSTSDKFEWIGYDACLMQIQDIAEFNSTYFNYMVASEESEAGAGWDYDNWLDDAYAKKSTDLILRAIVDSFISEQGLSSDQTLSYLNLSYMATYKSAWETMASAVKNLIASKSEFQTMAKTVQYYGTDSYSEGYSYFGIFDAKDFLNKLKSKYSSASTQITAAINAFNNLVAYSKAGSAAGNSYGLCCFFPMQDGSGYTCNTSSVYIASQTNFTNWRSIVTTYGD